MGANAGTPHERFTYNAFGTVNCFSGTFGTKASALYTTRFFTGQVLDAETGLMLYRNRAYHPTLGRFIHRDPIGYRAGDVSLYRYVNNATYKKGDIHGLVPNAISIWPDGEWSSAKFFLYYLFGSGQPIDLTGSDLLEEYRKAIRAEMERKMKNKFDEEKSMDCENNSQSTNGTMVITTAVGGGMFNLLTNIGNSSYSITYSCNASLSCGCCENEENVPLTISVNCTVNFKFDDAYQDPLDLAGPTGWDHRKLNRCMNACHDMENCARLAQSHGFSAYHACIRRRDNCIARCKGSYNSPDFGTPYRIYGEFSDSYSWTEKLRECR